MPLFNSRTHLNYWFNLLKYISMASAHTKFLKNSSSKDPATTKFIVYINFYNWFASMLKAIGIVHIERMECAYVYIWYSWFIFWKKRKKKIHKIKPYHSALDFRFNCVCVCVRTLTSKIYLFNRSIENSEFVRMNWIVQSNNWWWCFLQDGIPNIIKIIWNTMEKFFFMFIRVGGMESLYIGPASTGYEYRKYIWFFCKY